MADKVPCDCGHESDEPKLCDDCKRLMCPECYEGHRVKQALDAEGKPLSADLFEALAWYCPNCGHQNMMKLIKENPNEAVLTDEEEEKLRKRLGLEPWEPLPDADELGGILIHIPYQVTCNNCKLSFTAAMPPALEGDVDLTEDDDEDDDSYAA